MSTKSAEMDNRTVPYRAERVGRDNTGGEHYWSLPQRTVFVREANGEINIWPLEETPCEHLGHWVQHVRRVRGWDETQYQDTDNAGEALFGSAEGD